MAMIVVFQIPLRIFKILKTQRRISFGPSNASSTTKIPGKQSTLTSK